MSKNKKYDKLIVLDLEATCDNPKPSWESEIIEIGVCLLDVKTLEISEAMGIMVKPEMSPITPFCTSLTTITPEMIAKEGMHLSEAMEILKREYKIDQRNWASWGDYDRKQLTKECSKKQIEWPGHSSTHLNIKQILGIEHGWGAGLGLDKALQCFNMELLGTHHRGKDDAVNIARIYAASIKKIRSCSSTLTSK